LVEITVDSPGFTPVMATAFLYQRAGCLRMLDVRVDNGSSVDWEPVHAVAKGVGIELHVKLHRKKFGNPMECTFENLPLNCK
jgi:hypothetical protein